MANFSEKVRAARQARGLSQSDLARLVGVSVRSIAKYESGGVIPRGAVLRSLCDALEVSSEYLLNEQVDDPGRRLLEERYVERARTAFGGRGAAEMADLLQRNVALFAGGDLDQDAKDAFFDALMTAYVTCKEEARRRYGPKRGERS